MLAGGTIVTTVIAWNACPNRTFSSFYWRNRSPGRLHACPMFRVDRCRGCQIGRCSMLTAIRGGLVWFRDDPFLTSSDEALVYVEDGLLVCRDGKITAAGDYARLVRDLPENTRVVHYRDKLILPGLVSCHVHYVQARIIAAYGRQLLDWLKTYVYPEEMRFSDPAYARAVAALLCDLLLRTGTTTAIVNCPA